ncbi:hypothetical protein E2C01_100298 [Portunus trituberculatus]|uniref:Uncharacterized protein n=1 Tax=Portunus trituberculatus TaxID=210409 RepID=A0A5B7K2P1_PORTR|nr:hypothetical protein [Portunus trituberculatus]
MNGRKTPFPSPWRRRSLPAATGKEADDVLRRLLVRYQKIEKKERVHSRERKEIDMLSPGDIKKILISPIVQTTLEKAA